MSIATVVTRGYGTFAGVKFVAPRGYLAGSPPPTGKLPTITLHIAIGIKIASILVFIGAFCVYAR